MHSGAAELLLRAPGTQGKPLVLLQRPASASHEGTGCWALPNAELCRSFPGRIRMRGELVDHRSTGGPCTTVIADVSEPLSGQASHAEADIAWVPEPEVVALDLSPAFAARWPGLRAPETGLLVDAANVVGSRPDGWWRDRVGAAERLLRAVAAAGPAVLAVPPVGFRWVARLVVVLEGAAKQASDVSGVEVVRAPGSGDDTIVDLARRGGDWVVVTADRGLRARLPQTSRTLGPAALRSWLTAGTTHPGDGG